MEQGLGRVWLVAVAIAAVMVEEVHMEVLAALERIVVEQVVLPMTVPPILRMPVRELVQGTVLVEGWAWGVMVADSLFLW